MAQIGIEKMKVSAVMSRFPVTVSPDTPVRDAAAVMRDNDVGLLPIVDDARAVGVVTDRDMVVSVLALKPDAGNRPVRDAMSSGPVFCRTTQSVAEAAAMMGDAQVERLLVVDKTDRLVGIITVGDIAVNASEVLAGQAVGEICEDRGAGHGGHRIKPRE